MAPRKDQVDRLAWQWAETTSPEDVMFEHVLSAYILHPPHSRKTACKKNCRHQPLCLSGLGEHEWLHGGDATRLFTGTEEEPDVRPAHVPAGLKNLGATCYVNSLLQLWFHNRKFRRAILQWEPHVDPVEQLNETLLTRQYVPMTPIGHLQLIFGYMHGGRLRTVDPSPFILSLRLDTMYQQDAQEFSKLFSTLLEEGLSHQSRPEVRGAVQDLMRGEYQYVTRCNECLQESTCPSYFYELDLQIQGQKQLSDCLAEFLREESLTGANQYNCQTCQAKRDASRAIRLTSLPPVLNFQLMRFVFDRETGLKKKLSSHLRFPELLDVSEYVRQPAGSVTYRLQAVLLHKGPSAYSGHYTAHICDSETGAWFRFNDEEVEKIKTLKLTAEDELEDPTKKSKQSRCPKGFHSSNQAYMLVYGRVTEPRPSAGQTPAELTLPDHIQTMVDAMNAGVDDQFRQNEQAKSVSVEEYRCREREVREIYPRLPCADVRRRLLLLPAAWLAAWLAGEPPGPVDMSDLLCRHGRLSPWHAAKTKCVDPGAGNLLTCLYGGSGLDETALCRDCIQNRCRAIRAKLALEEDARMVSSLLREDLSPDTPAVWVGKTTLRIWKRLALLSLPQGGPPAAPSAASDTSCPTSPAARRQRPGRPAAGSPGPAGRRRQRSDSGAPAAAGPAGEQAAQERRTSAEAAAGAAPRPEAALNGTGSTNGVRPGPAAAEPSPAAVAAGRSGSEEPAAAASPVQDGPNGERAAADHQPAEPPNTAASASASTSAADGTSNGSACAVASGSGRPAQNGTTAAAESDSDGTARGASAATETDDTSGAEDDEFNGDIRCSHGELCVEEGTRRLVPRPVWHILTKYFPDAKEYGRDQPLCAQCREQVSEEEQMRQLYRQMAAEQRAALADLYSDRLRPQVAAAACPAGRYHAVGRDSTELWRKFLKDPARRDPASLETRSLICRHGGLLFSPSLRADRERMVFLYDWEWDVVRRSGHDGCEVIITRTEADPTLTVQPEPCDECIQSRHAEEHQKQLQYASTKIFIRKVDNLEEEMEEIASKRLRLDSGPEPVRRSSRPRRTRGEKPLSVASTDTLRDLKVQIMKAFKVAPYDQHLVFNGLPLMDSQATLGHLGIVPGSTLLLKVDEASDVVDLTASEDLTAAANPEMGFKGTGLVGS